MSHNFQEVIDELHRGRDLLTSTSGAQGRLDDVSAVLGNVHSRVSTYCSDAAQDAAKYLAAAQGAIDDLRHCISGYNDANEQLIVAIIGSPTITRASRSIGHSAIELTKFAHTGTLKNAQRTLDPKGTKRDDNGCLHGPSGQFTNDPYRVHRDIDHHARITMERDHITEAYKAWVSKTINDKDAAWENARAIERMFSYISQNNHEKATSSKHAELDERAIYFLALLKEMLDSFARKEYWFWHTALTVLCEARPKALRHSEHSGEVAGSIYSSDNGHTMLIGVKESDDVAKPPTGRNKFDQVSISSDQNKLIIIENKGGNNPQRGSRITATGERAEQGSLQYLIDLLTGVNQDKRLPRVFAALSNDDNLNSFCKNLEDGHIELEYLGINMDNNGGIHMAKYDLGDTIRLQGSVTQFQNVRIINDKLNTN